MERILIGDEYDYLDLKNEDDEDDFDFGLETKGKIHLAVTSPVLVPTAYAVGLVVGLLFLPVGAGFVIKDRIIVFKKLSKYRKDKAAFANKRATLYIEK